MARGMVTSMMNKAYLNLIVTFVGAAAIFFTLLFLAPKAH
jgi:hypothetical protein